MKSYSLLLLGLLFVINTCRMPSEPLGEIKIIKHLDTINTGGNCLDLDVDIKDSVLVAAANYNGYFIYDLKLSAGMITNITERKHIGADAMDNNLGDNRAQSVILSQKHDIAFVMDQYDHVWLYKYEKGATQYAPPNYLEEDCTGGTWLSLAIDDQMDRIGVYTLLKHNAAEDNVGDFLKYSTSLVWTNLKGVDPSNTSTDQREPNCEYIINQSSIAEKIYFDDGLLSMAYGELGVKVFKQTELEICFTDTGFVDLDGSELCASGEIDNITCCEAPTTCPEDLINPNTEECVPYFIFGHGGKHASAGGIIPEIYAEFDTPGEVEAVYSMGNTIFTGLAYSNGCMSTTLDDDGSIISTYQFAEGYTIQGIHQDGGLLALAAGHDGILLYNWNGNTVSFIGKIETSYANNVKVASNIIFAATEDGIEIIQIDSSP